MRNHHLTSLFLISVVAASCATKNGSGINGYDCDQTTGVCTPHDAGVAGAPGTGGGGHGTGGLGGRGAGGVGTGGMPGPGSGGLAGGSPGGAGGGTGGSMANGGAGTGGAAPTGTGGQLNGMGGQGGSAGQGGAGGQAGAGGQGGMPAPDIVPTISITKPSGTTRTNASVSIEVAVQPSDVTSIDLIRNGTVLTTLSPPFTYVWNTTSEPETSYQLTARVTYDGHMVVSNPVTVIVDRTPPGIVQQHPAPGEQGIDTYSPIQVVFSEPLAPTSVTPSAISIMAGSKTVPCAASLGSDSETITCSITDRSTLSLPQNLSATVLPTVTDLAGNSVGTNPSWSFTAPAWLTTTTISGGTAALAVGKQRRPVVAYTTPTGAAIATYVNDAWSPIPLPTSFMTAASGGYSLDADANGNVAIAYIATNPGDAVNSVHVSVWDGNSWSGYGSVDSGPGSTATALPTVKFSPGGLPSVAWLDTITGASKPDVYVAKWMGDWRPLGHIGLMNPLYIPMAVAFRDSLTPIVSWADATAGVGVSIWSSPSSWTMTPATMNTSPQALPTIALDGASAPMIPTYTPDFRVLHLNASSWTNQETPLNQAIAPSKAVISSDHMGRPVVAWLDGPQPYSVGLTHWIGNQWDLRFGFFTTVPSDPVHLFVDPDDRIWVVVPGDSGIAVWKSNY